VEVSGVSSKGAIRDELFENVRPGLTEAIETNRAEALAAAANDYEAEHCLSAQT
jgi:hypothetical protein